MPSLATCPWITRFRLGAEGWTQQASAAAASRQGQVLRDGQVGGGPHERILEDPADQVSPPVFGPLGHFLVTKKYPAAGPGKASTDGAQQTRLP